MTKIDRRRTDGPAAFATTAVALAAAALAIVVVLALRTGADSEAATSAFDEAANLADGGDESDDAVADPSADPTEIVAEAATSMAAVTSVEFELDRSGAPVFIDEFASIALDRLLGQFTVPSRARALLAVTIDDSTSTEIAAVAIDDEIWISNPVTGDFETLPSGFDIDPSRFFDPEGGWQPLLANLGDVELVGIDDRGGQRYHVRGTAPAEQVRNITVGLVRDQDVPVDLWIHPDSLLVTAAEFGTTIDGATSRWVLVLDRYGDAFEIDPPANVRS